ncbi:VOC family protein [Acinetobacter haemolyticus]|uniref:VOC family protein n=1 Tax=Acinetobacter haemolyticus TaxID=29430 RepID=UPI000D68D315|nr:VOC family protein [Acinetobacter haemolyticus]
MKPHISILTLGVNDLEQSLIFYRDGLGLQTDGIVGQEFEHCAVAFFNLQRGLKLAIFAQQDLAIDAGLIPQPISSTGMSIGHNVSNKSEVDEIMETAKKAGAVIVKQAQNTFYGGYAGYFLDPNGHLWEIVWNPQIMPPSDC